MGLRARLIYFSVPLFLLSFHVFLFDSTVMAEALNKNKEGASRKTATETVMNDVLEGFDDDPVKGFLDGFDDDTSDLEEKKIVSSEKSRISLSGHLELGSSYNYAHRSPDVGETDWRGLSKLRLELLVKFKIDLSDNWKGIVSGSGFFDSIYQLREDANYSDPVLEDYEKEVEFRELFLQGSLSQNTDLKLGRQIVVWGKSDNIRITDVLNPLNNREPGITNLESLRLPVFMTRLDYYFGKVSISGIAIHEILFNKDPVSGSDFYPYETTLPEENIPDTDFENTEWAMAVNCIFDKWDISFYLARIFDDQAHIELAGSEMYLEHARLTMVGLSSGYAMGNWMFKSEAAYFDGMRFFNVPDTGFSRMDFMFGFEYSGFKETFIGIEAVNRHYNNWNPAVEQSPDYAIENDFQIVLHISKEFLNNTLALSFIGSAWGVDAGNGSFQRYTAKYDISDSLNLLVGLIDYQSGDKIEMKNIGNNDRIYVSIRYSF